MSTASPYSNFNRLFSIREALQSLNPAQEPCVHFFARPELATRSGRLGVLSGSFNPLTNAHVALATAAREQLGLEAIFFAISKVTVDKEQVEVASIEDRILVLQRYVRRRPGYGVLALNRGLYADQAEALAATLSGEKEIYFIVGLDKALQIFDRHYYDDMETALTRLFDAASLAIAPRGNEDIDAFKAFLQRPENDAYRHHITFIDMPNRYNRLTSSDVRQLIFAGKKPIGYVPSEVMRFIEETGAYQKSLLLPNGDQVDCYGLRLFLLEAFYVADKRVGPHADLKRLLKVATEDSDEGRSLRALLTKPSSEIANLLSRSAYRNY